MPSDVKGYPYAFHIALDGNGINGLEGFAGVCLFLYDPSDDSYAYKIVYYDGIAGGHAVSVNPNKTVGFLGNAGQHLLFYDATTLDEIGRLSTLGVEPTPTSLQGSTHLAWTSDREFITAVGANFYRFSLDDLAAPELMGPHGVKLPHAMKFTSSGRYLCYGSMDTPVGGAAGAANHVGIWDMETGEASVVSLPATCWHLVPGKSGDLFYAVSFRVEPQDYVDYHEWAMSYKKEYAFEIDLDSFASYRIIDERPDLATQLAHPQEVATQAYDILARGNVVTNSRHVFGALRVSRFSFLDSLYATQLSADQSLLFTANRGLNHITIYDYPAGRIQFRVEMPPIQDYFSFIPAAADRRLGFHHSVLIG